jgi:hypothetical protein
MSYETRIDELVGRHLAEYQREITLAKGLSTVKRVPPMPYGYPIRVYRPMHVCRIPQVKRFIARTGGTLSNGVPRVLRTELAEQQYPLGIYNPRGRPPQQAEGR